MTEYKAESDPMGGGGGAVSALPIREWHFFESCQKSDSSLFASQTPRRTSFRSITPLRARRSRCNGDRSFLCGKWLVVRVIGLPARSLLSHHHHPRPRTTNRLPAYPPPSCAASQWPRQERLD